MTDGSPLFPLATPRLKANRKLEVGSSFALFLAGQHVAVALIIPRSMTVRATILISALFTWHMLYAAPTERSVRPSRQFVIYGSDAALRGAVSDLAERTNANLLVLLRQRDNWTVPIVVNLQPQQANLPEVPPAGLRFSQTARSQRLGRSAYCGE